MDQLFRSLPLFKGKSRLARLLLSNAVKNQKDIEISGRYHCKYLLPNIVENVGFDIFINGQYEPEIHDLLFRLLPENGCFLDLGANIGSTVIPLCKRRADITAVAVEAAPWVFSYLQKNIALNDLKNVQLINNALFNEDDRELDFFSPMEKFGKGSLSPVFTQEGVKVKTRRVDTLVNDLKLSKVDLIKIDVEGFEYFVFKGAEDLLSAADAPPIIFEFVDWAEQQAMGLQPGAAQQLLVEMGYTLYEIAGRRLIKQASCYSSGAFNLLASKTGVNFY
ncbi:MAG: FkbM family methyltransferase [Ferruginibacter sp.]